MKRVIRGVQPVSNSCPACLGDLTVSRTQGGWLMICSGCGIIVEGGQPARVPAPA